MTNALKPAPVTLFVFNRPDLTQVVFDRIAVARPPTLIVVADGPRVHKEGEAELCAQARRITEKVTWDCEVIRHYSEANLGCKRRISSGITAVFKQFDRAIFLEDDCLPDLTFFRFCDELLERYKDDDRVGTINGSNLCLGRDVTEDSFFFSKYPMIWGWASWRRVWNDYDPGMAQWPALKRRGWLRTVADWQERKHWVNAFDKVHSGALDTWDFQLVFLLWLQGRVNIQPRTNLVSNIGFRADATHTTVESPFAGLAATPLAFPLHYPDQVTPNRLAEKLYRDSECSGAFGRFLGRLGW